MKKTRTKLVRVYLTTEALGKIAASAFENCRNVSQELSYMIERQLNGKTVNPAKINGAHAFVQTQTVVSEPKEIPGSVSREAAPSTKEPTEEERTKIDELIAQLNMSDSQIKATWLICETPERVISQLEEDLVQQAREKEAVV